jgi:hypothetical protein
MFRTDFVTEILRIILNRSRTSEPDEPRTATPRTALPRMLSTDVSDATPNTALHTAQSVSQTNTDDNAWSVSLGVAYGRDIGMGL